MFRSLYLTAIWLSPLFVLGAALFYGRKYLTRSPPTVLNTKFYAVCYRLGLSTPSNFIRDQISTWILVDILRVRQSLIESGAVPARRGSGLGVPHLRSDHRAAGRALPAPRGAPTATGSRAGRLQAALNRLAAQSLWASHLSCPLQWPFFSHCCDSALHCSVYVYVYAFSIKYQIE